MYLFNYCGKVKVVNLKDDPFVCLRFGYAQAIFNLLRSITDASARDAFQPIDLAHMTDCKGRPLSTDSYRVESVMLTLSNNDDLFVSIDRFLSGVSQFSEPTNDEIKEGIVCSLTNYAYI